MGADQDVRQTSDLKEGEVQYLKSAALVPVAALAVMPLDALTGRLSRMEAARTQNGCAS